MTRFVEMVLSPDNVAFRRDFLGLAQRVARYGIYNSLAQLAIKIGAPGVPDFYQGTELWDFSLVDPDNRRPVDYRKRRELLDEFDRSHAAGRAVDRCQSCCSIPRMIVSSCSRQRPCCARGARRTTCFAADAYEPLAVEGSARDHVFAFARVLGQRQAIVAVPRLVATLEPDGERAAR